MIQQGSVMEVIYFKRYEHSCTVAIKVSPELRLHMIDKLDSRLFLFSGRCHISDRFYYKQCFHCQKYGHIKPDCPDKHLPPTCMYCAGSHESSTCPVKHNPSSHRCANCLNSKSNVSTNSCNHTARSNECPVGRNIISRICSKTQFSVTSNEPKNSSNAQLPSE